MADRISQTGQSTWYWYRLDPADLAVEARSPEANGISMVWKGGADVTRLGDFFVDSVKAISAGFSPNCHVWIVTAEGPRDFEVPLAQVTPVPPVVAAQASYLRFECRLGADARKPDLAVWLNFDEHAANLDELQQCVGIHVMPNYLPLLENGISSMVASMASRFFPSGSYQPGVVLDCLRQLQHELPQISLEGAVP